MDELDRKILEFVQRAFPLEPRPFLKIASEFGISESEAFQKNQSLKKSGIIRRVGAVIDAEALGAEKALVACRVELGRIDEIAELVNHYDEVTHNYLRDGAEFNLWFTVVAKRKSDFERILSEIKNAVGEKNILVLDAVKTFKLQAVFDSDAIGSVDEKFERA